MSENERELLVGYSEMHRGWCIFEQTDYAEYALVDGPFPNQDAAIAALEEES